MQSGTLADQQQRRLCLAYNVREKTLVGPCQCVYRVRATLSVEARVRVRVRACVRASFFDYVRAIALC